MQDSPHFHFFFSLSQKNTCLIIQACFLSLLMIHQSSPEQEKPALIPSVQVLSLEAVQQAWDNAGIAVLVSLHAAKRGLWVITIQGKKRFMSYGPSDNTHKLMRRAIKAAINRTDQNFDFETCRENGKLIKSVRESLGETLKSFCTFINESAEFRQDEPLKTQTLKSMESGHTENKSLFISCQIILKRLNGENEKTPSFEG